jgi:hypothetical protein
MAFQDFVLILRFTRHWIHYGLLGHLLACALIAGISGLFHSN